VTTWWSTGLFWTRIKNEKELIFLFPCAPLQFRKRRQLFIVGTYNETLTDRRDARQQSKFRPSQSNTDTQPQLQPALLRLSAMISQYFMRSARLLIVLSHLRFELIQFELCAHFLNLRGLLFHLCR
jgi:hypothetical protein